MKKNEKKEKKKKKKKRKKKKENTLRFHDLMTIPIPHTTFNLRGKGKYSNRILNEVYQES